MKWGMGRRYKVTLGYTETANPSKVFEITYTVEAEDEEEALYKARKQFDSYKSSNYGTWIRKIVEDKIKIEEIK